MLRNCPLKILLPLLLLTAFD